MATKFTRETSELIKTRMDEQGLRKETLAHKLNMHSADIHNALNYECVRSVHKKRLQMIAQFFGIEPEFESFITLGTPRRTQRKAKRIAAIDLNNVIIDISTQVLLEPSVSEELKMKAIDLIKTHSA